MTRAKAHELFAVQADRGGGCSRNAAKPILVEVQHDHDRVAVDAFLREFDLEHLCAFNTGTRFTAP